MTDQIIAIKQTLAQYCHRVDRGTASEVAALFAEDAVLQPRYDGDYDVRGRAAIERWYAFYHANLRAEVRHLKHLIHSMMIDVDGDTATSVCYLTAYFITTDDGVAYQVQGTYFDTLRHIANRWLLQTRRIEVEFMTPLAEVSERMQPMGFDPD